jgi:FtsH-binding integral membrane protein
MFTVFALIRKYSFVLIVIWMALYAFDLIDDLRNNYYYRSPVQVAWMLFSDFVRCMLVIAIWVAANFDTGKRENK